ncbi:MAG: HindIII family type II restriction endonuclease [Rubrobacter sp.]|nr:HindIII family type II restriction endonuclease [Rubrobacter sp.]
MKIEVISKDQIDNRRYWINKISKLSGNFGADSKNIEQELSQEMADKGVSVLIGHLRLCGAIPEQYGHDSSEEKLYSKYTDVVISKSYEALGLRSLILTERSDAADVECVADDYSLRYCQMLWIAFDHAASFSSTLLTNSPLTNTAPALTRQTR